MTQDEALKLAFDWYASGNQDPDEFEKLIKAIAKLEREACAKLCDDMVLYTGYDCAAAIRARGQA